MTTDATGNLLSHTLHGKICECGEKMGVGLNESGKAVFVYSCEPSTEEGALVDGQLACRQCTRTHDISSFVFLRNASDYFAGLTVFNFADLLNEKLGEPKK